MFWGKNEKNTYSVCSKDRKIYEYSGGNAKKMAEEYAKWANTQQAMAGRSQTHSVCIDTETHWSDGTEIDWVI